MRDTLDCVHRVKDTRIRQFLCNTRMAGFYILLARLGVSGTMYKQTTGKLKMVDKNWMMRI